MALYKYVAKDLSSKRVMGKMEVADQNELIRVLKTQKSVFGFFFNAKAEG